MDHSFCIFARQNFRDISDAMTGFYFFLNMFSLGVMAKMLIRDKIRFIPVEMRAEVKQLRVMMHLYRR